MLLLGNTHPFGESCLTCFMARTETLKINLIMPPCSRSENFPRHLTSSQMKCYNVYLKPNILSRKHLLLQTHSSPTASGTLAKIFLKVCAITCVSSCSRLLFLVYRMKIAPVLIQGPWKKKCLAEFGIVTQCIAPTRVNDQYLTNVLLKINVKMGGMNSLLAMEPSSSSIPLVSRVPTFIVGMDISHGSPGHSDVSPVAAVVSSMKWPSVCRYRAHVRTQSPKHEMIALSCSLCLMKIGHVQGAAN